MNISEMAIINNIIIKQKIAHLSMESCLFVLLAVKSFEIFLKHSEYGFISEAFDLN